MPRKNLVSYYQRETMPITLTDAWHLLLRETPAR